MEKFQPERFVANETKDLSREQLLDQEAGRVLGRALRDVGEVFKNARNASDNPQIKQQLKQEASSALTKLYTRMKKNGEKVVRLLSILIISSSLSYEGMEKAKDHLAQKNLPAVQHLDRKKLPFLLGIVDHYICSDVVNTYNKCVRFLALRQNGKMSPEEIRFKERIVSTIDPFGYGTYSENKERLRKINSDSPDDIIPDAYKGRLAMEREDFFRIYLGLPQKNNTLLMSPYQPSTSKESKKSYYQFNAQKLLTDIFTDKYGFFPADKNLNLESAPDTHEFHGQTFSELIDYVKKHGTLPRNHFTSHLGKYKAYVGYDKKRDEHYVSYYDKWDLDPPELKGLLEIDIDQFNFPFEIYGRIYETDFNHFQVLKDI